MLVNCGVIKETLKTEKNNLNSQNRGVDFRVM